MTDTSLSAAYVGMHAGERAHYRITPRVYSTGELQFLARSHGWLRVGREAHGNSFGPGVLYTTSDTGRSWIVLKLP